MSKKTIFLSLLLFVVFLIATVPARTALGLLPDSVPVKASGVSGSLWSGSAASVQVNRQTVSNVEWSINPFWLLTGKLGGSVELTGNDATAVGGWKMGVDQTLYLNGMQVDFPANRVSGFLPMKGMALEGDFRAEIDSLSFNQATGPQGVSATLFWLKGAASIAGPVIDLGDFTIAAKSKDDKTIELVLKPSKNALDAKGKATIRWPQTIELDISVTEEVPDELKSTIAFLKKADNNRRTLEMTLPLKR